jgi:hypothetical protein
MYTYSIHIVIQRYKDLILNRLPYTIQRNLKKDVCANHNYGTEENLIYVVRRYLRCIGSWPKL